MFLQRWSGVAISATILLSACASVYEQKIKADILVQESVGIAKGQKWAIASQGPMASRAAEEIFAQGGNIADAMVAVSLVLGVERPHSTGLGGGGFVLFKMGKDMGAWDFRETAPQRASKNMFLDSRGKLREDLSTQGAKASAVPGLIFGLAEFHKRYGKLAWAELFKPAIRLAKEGFEVYPELAQALKEEGESLSHFHSSRKVFFKANGEVLELGEKLVQRDLALTLEKIAARGAEDFYRGSIARAIVASQHKNGGLIDSKDLANYKMKIRSPLKLKWGEYEVLTMPPPSAGGLQVLQVLKATEKYPLKGWGQWNPKSIHAVVATLQQSFADRTQFGGDPDFTTYPVDNLLSDAHLQKIQQTIELHRARSSAELAEADRGPSHITESSDTVHFSIMDSEGNTISTTQTINGKFGSALVVEGTGILMNNEMDDFATKAGAMNLYGQVGSSANEISAGRRPLSSMAPTLILKGDQVLMGLGSPSGTRIPSCVAQVLLNRYVYGMDSVNSLASIRYHHQWYPDEIQVESPGLPATIEASLKTMGYATRKQELGCKVQVVERRESTLEAYSDPRGAGLALSQ